MTHLPKHMAECVFCIGEEKFIEWSPGLVVPICAWHLHHPQKKEPILDVICCLCKPHKGPCPHCSCGHTPDEAVAIKIDSIVDEVVEIMRLAKRFGGELYTTTTSIRMDLRRLVDLARQNLPADWLQTNGCKLFGHDVAELRRALIIAESHNWR